MKVAWADERCILCLGTPKADEPMTARSDAHVIPRSIGGKLSALFLCKDCNGRMGRFEATLAQDISVRLLLDKLEHQLPEKVIKSIRYRQSYFTDHPELGRIEAGMDKEGELRPKESDTIKGDENTLKQAMAELDRLDAGDEEKAALQDAFDKAHPGEWIEVRPGYRIQKHIGWSGVGFKPSLTDPITITPLQVSVGIAYLYLALCIGEQVYDPVLQPVRDALQAGLDGDSTAADAYNENRHGTGAVDPVHILRAKPDGDGTVVTFQVFRDLVWPVRFPGTANPEQTLYALNVATGEEHWKSKAPS